MLTWISSERDHWSNPSERSREGPEIFVSPSFLSWKVCLCVCAFVRAFVRACVRERALLRLKVHLCLHMWACVFVCIWVSVWWRRKNALCLTFYSVAVWLFKSACMSNYTLLSLFFPFVVPRGLLLDRAQLDSAAVLRYIRELTLDWWWCVGCGSPHEFRTATWEAAAENVHFFF